MDAGDDQLAGKGVLYSHIPGCHITVYSLARWLPTAGSVIVLVKRQVAKAVGDAQTEEGPLPAAPGLPRDDGSAHALQGQPIGDEGQGGVNDWRQRLKRCNGSMQDSGGVLCEAPYGPTHSCTTPCPSPPHIVVIALADIQLQAGCKIGGLGWLWGQGGRTRVPLQLAARHQRCRATAGAAGRGTRHGSLHATAA